RNDWKLKSMASVAWAIVNASSALEIAIKRLLRSNVAISFSPLCSVCTVTCSTQRWRYRWSANDQNFCGCLGDAARPHKHRITNVQMLLRTKTKRSIFISNPSTYVGLRLTFYGKF